MSSDTLSSVLEEQIRRLCLNDFPCGPGSWRRTKDGTDGVETEETDALLDLLSCPRSPWTDDESWSPQAAALRRLAARSPRPLLDDFVYDYFTTLRVVDKGVAAVDKGVLKFSKLEELVLSANRISEISAENLPRTLRILELRANCLSALDGLTSCPPPQLHYLGLGSNSLHSQEDVSHLTGGHWPQLVCLDLSDCQFKDQRALMEALMTLPSLGTLVLQGNPFTLASCYPGFTVDSLPRLSCLDASRISPEERRSFSGFAEMSDPVTDQATVTVSVGRMRGIAEPLTGVKEKAPGSADVSYFVTYELPRRQTPNNLNFKSESEFEAADEAPVTEDASRDPDLQSREECERETLEPDTRDSMVHTEETCHDHAPASTRSTTKLTWSESMDFSDTQTCTVSDLGALKRFLNRGLHLTIEEEKVVSRPADDTTAKPRGAVKGRKGGKGRESSVNSGSTKEKSKGKKKMSAPELHTSVSRTLGSVHVPLQNLVKSGQCVNVVCNFGILHSESEVEAGDALEKDPGKKIKAKKKEDKESRGGGGSGVRQKITSASKGKGKGNTGCEPDAFADNSASVQPEPVTVELRVELEKWESPPEAHRLQPVST